MFRRFRKKNIAVIDIGSTRIICLILRFQANKKTTILGYGQCESEGFKDGVILDKKLLQNSLSTALFNAEKMANLNVEDACITFSSTKFQNIKNISTSLINNKNIDYEDIKNNLKKSLESIDDQYSIIDYQILNYNIDSLSNIMNPVGLSCEKMSMTNLVTILPKILLKNIVSVLNSLHLNIIQVIPSVIASSNISLTQEEKDLGVVHIDFGGNTTSCVAYLKNKIIFNDTLPVGGQHITRDIASTISMKFSDAERIKILHGSISDDFFDKCEMIEIKKLANNLDTYPISTAFLNEIIYARVEEIIVLLKNILKKQDKNILGFNRVVISGGGAMLNGMTAFLEKSLNAQVRTYQDSYFQGTEIENYILSYVAVIGAMIMLSKNQNKLFINDENKNSSMGWFDLLISNINKI